MVGKMIRLPKRFTEHEDGDPIEEARYFARLYQNAKSSERRGAIIKSLKKNARRYDGFTVSVCYYNIFENVVGRGFGEFWIGGKSGYGKTINQMLAEYDKERQDKRAD
jgi:hypothetical protein